jgi:hypothetical protein
LLILCLLHGPTIPVFLPLGFSPHILCSFFPSLLLVRMEKR